MPIRLFSLKDVPDDEAEEVRELLSDNAIDFYETPPNKWGFSPGAIWLRKDVQRELAKNLISEYQEQRGIRMREAYEEQKRQGNVETVFSRLCTRPVQFILLIGFALFILYVSLMPFISF